MSEQETLAKLLEALPDAMIVVDDDGQIVYANSQAEAMFGYEPGALRNQPVEKLVPEALREQHMGYRREYQTTSAAHTMGQGAELDGVRQNGTHFPAEVTIRPLEVDNKVLLLACIHDVTEHKRAQEAEREQRALVAALRDAASTLNRSLELGDVLDRILLLLGEVVEHDAADVMLVDGNSAHVVRCQGYEKHGGYPAVLTLRVPMNEPSNLHSMLTTGQPYIIPDVRKDPRWIVVPGAEWIRSHIGAPIRLDGETIGFLTLTSRKVHFFTEAHANSLQAFAEQAAIAIRNARLYEAIRRQARELESSNRELDAFSQSVAHDLRSPLAGIMGYLAVLVDMEGPKLSEDGRAVLQEALRSANKMEQIIETMLLLARLRHAEETIAPVAVAQVIEAAIERCYNDIAARRVTVTTDSELPPVLGYGPWLEEVFVNLIQNGIKYIGLTNKQPSIHIRARRDGDLVRYEVIDNGLGISAKDQAKLFEAFTRFHEGQAPGLGLGLSIVNRIIERLGGTLGVESEPGKGSIFWFALPPAESFE